MKTFHQILVLIQEKQKEYHYWMIESLRESKRPENMKSSQYVENCINLCLDLKNQINVLKWVLEEDKTTTKKLRMPRMGKELKKFVASDFEQTPF